MAQLIQKVVILGAGGLAREVLGIFRDVNDRCYGTREVSGFIDENPANFGGSLCGVPILGDFEWFQSVDKNELEVLCAVGATRAKKSMVAKAERIGLSFCSVIHPSVLLSEYVEIGVGTVITVGGMLTTQIQIGNHVYLNMGTTVGHDVTIDDFVTVAPGCHISGNVALGEGVDLGTGAVVLPGITIGKWSTIGAGAVVTKDIPDNAVAVGVPAKVIKYLEE